MRGRSESSRNGFDAGVTRHRVIADQRPVPAGHGPILLVEPLAHVDAVRDAVAVGDDQRGPVVGLRLAEGRQRLLRIGAHGDARDVDAAVGDRLEGDVLLLHGLAGGRELRHGAERRRLGHLAAGVGVDLGVEHQHVHVAPAGEDVVEPAGPDVVGPPVAADDPHAAPDQVLDDAQEVGHDGPVQPVEALHQLRHPFALVAQLRLPELRALQDAVHQLGAHLVAQLRQPPVRQIGVRVGGEPEAEAELGGVLEEGVRPCRPPAVGVGRPRRRRQVPAVDRGAPGRVGHRQPVAEQLRQQLDVRGLAAPCARGGELEQGLQELGSAHRAEVDPGAVVHRQRLEERDALTRRGDQRFALRRD